jgi:hypothetical protein
MVNGWIFPRCNSGDSMIAQLSITEPQTGRQARERAALFRVTSDTDSTS